MEILHLVGLVSLAVIIGFMFGYPILLSLLLKMKPAKTSLAETHEPPLTIIIPTIVGGDLINKRVDNIRGCDYPQDKIEVLIIDSSEAGVEERPDIRIKKQPRIGKTAAINLGFELAKNEIVINTDDDTVFESDSIRNAMGVLADPSVGAVLADINLIGTTRAARAYTLLNDFTRRGLRLKESALDTTPHACGEFLALKKGLIKRVDPKIIADDALIVFELRKKGYRSVVLKEVRASEQYSISLSDQFNRWRRGVISTLQIYRRFASMLFRPTYGLFGVLIAPVYFFKLILIPVLLYVFEGYILYLLALSGIMYLIVLGLIGVGGFLFFRRQLSAILYVPIIQLATIVGMIDYVFGRYSPAWNKHSK